MLPMPNASDLFTQQMRGRLGFGPSTAPNSANSPMGPYGGGSSTGAFDNPVSRAPQPLNLLGGAFTPPASTMTPFKPFGSSPVSANSSNGPYGGGSSTGNNEGASDTHTPITPLPLPAAQRPNGLGAANWGRNPWDQQAPKPLLNFDSLSNPTGSSPWDYGALQNTAIYGSMNNPYGPQGTSQYHSGGYLYPGGGMSYAPQIAFNPGAGVNNMMNLNALDMTQPDGFRADPFTNMNYNAPVYGNVAPFPGA